MKRAKIRKRLYTYKGKTKNRWLVTWTDAKGTRREKWHPNQRFAEAHARKVDRELEEGIHVADRDTITFGKACEAFLKDRQKLHRLREIAGNTVAGYERYARTHVLPAFSSKKLTKITWQQVQEWLDDKMIKDGYSKAHIKGMWILLDQVFKYAKTQEWLKLNPLRDPHGKPLVKIRGKDPENRIPETPEIRACLKVLLDGAKPNNVPHLSWSNRCGYFVLAAFLGLRQGEISGLLRKHVDMKKATVEVRHSQSVVDGLKAPKSEAGVRDIPMDPLTYKVLGKHFAGLDYYGRKVGPDDYVFATRNGRPLSHQVVCAMHNEILEAAGLLQKNGRPKFTPHSLRKYAGSLWLARGMDTKHVSWLLGHASSKITEEVYVKQLKDDTRARDVMAQLHGQFPEFKPMPLPASVPPIPEELPAPETTADEPAAAPVALPIQFWGQPWLPEAIQLIQSGVSMEETAKRVDVNIRKAYTWLERAGLKNPGLMAREVRHRRFRELLDQGCQFPQIAEATYCNYHEVWQWAQRNGRRPQSTPPSARTQKRIRQITSGIEKGRSLEEVAAAQGISERYAARLLELGRAQAVDNGREFALSPVSEAGKRGNLS